jgi:hypothetical protein
MTVARRSTAQQGAAMLVLAAVLVLGVSAFMVSALNQAPDAATVNRQYNARVLHQAKDALIGYVAKEVLDLSEDIPGRLPCPESPGDAGGDFEGRAANICAPGFANKTVGRLPWRTLGIDKLVDAANEPLWYAVSPNWVLDTTAVPPPLRINTGTLGQLSVEGVGNVVAVIIAPGRPLSVNPVASQTAAGCAPRDQSRYDKAHNPAASANPNYLDYLECQNASNPIDSAFAGSVVDNATNAALNDQLVYVTAEDVLNAIQGPLAERMQRTVAPLLSEFSDLWPGGDFLPYAVPFTPPEAALAPDAHCGPAAPSLQPTEGLLPIALSTGACSSAWTGFNVSGSVSFDGCTTISGGNVRCSFRYYRLTALGALLFGGGTTATDVTVQARAPRAAATFRHPLQPADIIVPPGASVQALSLTPKTDGDADLALQVRIAGTSLCDNVLLGVVCWLLGGSLATDSAASIEFPQLGLPLLQGTKASAGVLLGHATPYNFDLLSPSPGDPHYWFMRNEWYRYTYYAVAPSATAAAAGGNLTVNGFPPANGSTSDKRFVLALMGPAVTGQVRGPAALLGHYVEGPNAATTASPRAFAYQVYALAGNDRIATCPFTDGATPCD